MISLPSLRGLKLTKKQSYLEYNDKAIRLARRRALEKTEEFNDRYRHRSGITIGSTLLFHPQQQLGLSGDALQEGQVVLTAGVDAFRQVTGYFAVAG